MKDTLKDQQRSLFETNRNKILNTVCKRCNEDFPNSSKTCPKCNNLLDWICTSCGACRSYSNLSVHNCNKILKRNYLKERFKRQKNLVKKALEKEIQICIVKSTLAKEILPLRTLDAVKIENLLNKN